MDNADLLTAALEQSSEGIAVTDLAGSFIFINQAFADMHRYQPEELMGKHMSICHDTQDMMSLVAARRYIVQAGDFSGETRHLRKDGTCFPGLLQGSLVRDGNGNPVAILMALRNITDIKRTEEALQAGADKLTEYCRSLEAQVTDCSKDLERSRKEAEAYAEEVKGANEALRVLVGGIDQQKKSVEKAIQDSFSLTVKPILEQLKTEDLPNRVADLIDLLTSSLENIADPFATKGMANGYLLTLREIRICELISSGLTSKEIANIMGVSPQTIFFHRSNIRKKLGLTGTANDLGTYLRKKAWV
ncbi:MAG: PAS domain S-box protein [Desulfomonilaceae bacterium]